MEDIAAGIQAVLLLGAAGAIIYSAARRIILGEDVIQLTEAGIGVMLVSLIVSIILSRHLFRVARATGSVALEANAHNVMGDIYSTAGVLVGLVVVRFTGFTVIDPILAVIVSLLILRATYKVSRTALSGLIDVRLPKSEEDAITSSITEHTGQLVGFHDMRTRRAGNQRYIDLHLVMPKGMSVEDAHQMSDHLEQDIKTKLPNASVTIHVEPCGTDCQACHVTICTPRQQRP